MRRKPDPALRRKFRKGVEEKLELARVNNPGVIVSWTLSSECDRVDLVCDQTVFNERVINHLGESLVRLLGVGKQMGLVDREIRALVVECVSQQTSGVAYFAHYEVD